MSIAERLKIRIRAVPRGGRIIEVLLAACMVVLIAGAPVSAAGPAGRTGTASSSSGKGSRTYDVILFWGQSNMVGDAIGRTAPFTATKSNASYLSRLSGIDEDILLNTVSAISTAIDVPGGTAYEYSLADGSLTPITGSTIMGDLGTDAYGIYAGVTFNSDAGVWERCHYINGVPSAKQASCAALMTNMVNAFCAEYYKKTGHGVIALMNAVGGTTIRAFLPMNDPDYLPDSIYTNGAAYEYIWEGIQAASTGVTAAARVRGLNISGFYFVSFQGESDITDEDYADYYKKVVKNLRSIGFTKGALVETSNEIGNALFTPYVRSMHEVQEKLIAGDDNLCLGSSLDYDHYVPDMETYNGKDAYWRNMWNNVSWNEAYAAASLLTDTVPANRIHLNSAALSMIGRETADNLAELVYGTK